MILQHHFGQVSAALSGTAETTAPTTMCCKNVLPDEDGDGDPM